jgi:tRNA pseudouridine38-40 synthase
MNIKLILSYDGRAYQGSQKQPNYPTVQSTLENCLKILGIKNSTLFSGRTDKGVHATKQVVSIEIPEFWQDLKKLKKELNSLLESSIKIRHIQEVPQSFHARFSAQKRSYRYLISKVELTAFNSAYFHYESDLNISLLKEASKEFIGVHDFLYFSKKGSDPKSTVREIFKINIYEKNNIIIINFIANSYLRSQIRMIVDFLLKVSKRKLSIQNLKTQLQRKELISWTLAPAQALYLSKVSY